MKIGITELNTSRGGILLNQWENQIHVKALELHSCFQQWILRSWEWTRVKWKLIKFRNLKVMKSVFYNPKNRAQAIPQFSRMEKRIGALIDNVLLIFDSNNENSIIIAENLEINDPWDRVFQLLCSRDFYVKEKRKKEVEKKERKRKEKEDQNFFSGTWAHEVWLRQIHQIKFTWHSIHWDTLGNVCLKFSPAWMATSNLSVNFNFKLNYFLTHLVDL